MKKLLFVTIFAAMALVAGAQKNTTTLRLNLEKGKKYSQTSTAEMEMGMDFMGEKITSQMTMEIGLSMKVLDVQNDTFKLATSYESMKIDIVFPGKEAVSYNSADLNSSSSEISEAYSWLIGKSFIMKMDVYQNIISIEGLNEMIEDMLSSRNYSEEKQQALNSILELLSEEKMKEHYSSTNIVFPKEPISKGYSWTTEGTQDFQNMFKLQTKTTYKVAKITATTVEITAVQDFTMNMAFDNKENTIFSFDMKNTNAKSTYSIDLATGWTKAAQSDIAVDLGLKMKISDEQALQMDMKATVKTRVK